MTQRKKVLYISQEIFPYLPESEMANIGQQLPLTAQASNYDVRIFMPRFGSINERRNQLHEVIRLSGLNIIIDDTDHPLILKVASLQPARLQVYFIYNDDYFMRRGTVADENGEEFADNDERMIFFTRGVLETVKKLRWTPDIIHCQGWITALTPLYLRKAYHQDPFFRDSKIVYSVFDDKMTKTLHPEFTRRILFENIKKGDITALKDSDNNTVDLAKLAIDYSDAVIQASEQINPEITEYVKNKNRKFLPFTGEENHKQNCIDFYSNI
jgi:Glycogen synthase